MDGGFSMKRKETIERINLREAQIKAQTKTNEARNKTSE
jgi:hypothetical protein